MTRLQTSPKAGADIGGLLEAAELWRVRVLFCSVRGRGGGGSAVVCIVYPSGQHLPSPPPKLPLPKEQLNPIIFLVPFINMPLQLTPREKLSYLYISASLLADPSPHS